MNNKVATLLKYSIGFILATSLFFLTIGIRDIYNVTDKQEIYRFLSDGFTIPGVLFICLGLLVWFSNLGSLSGIGYALKHLFSMLIPVGKKKHETYAQYVEARKEVSGYAFLFIIGGVFLALGIVFMILYF